MLYTLNLYSAVCQLYLNKTGKKKVVKMKPLEWALIQSAWCP